MFRSDSQRRAMFAAISADGRNSSVKFSFGPKKKAKVVAEIMAELGSIDRTTHLGAAHGVDEVPTDVIYDNEQFIGNDGVYIQYVPEVEIIGKPLGVSLESHIVEEPVREVIEVESLDDYFNMNKEKIERSGGNILDGASTVIEVDGDRSVDIRADKKTDPRDLKKFSIKPKSLFKGSLIG